ncbi:MAG: archaemetzincin family Zn-dependent metalloprotease [Nanoarchaeota archaeon]|nr:archaemetzincin family Zn-dependent metalloprotease [Nanoarchaeota archaeon]
MLIRVVPVGNPPEKIMSVLCSQIENSLGIKCRLIRQIPLPEHALNIWRRQYNCETIMQEVSNIPEVKFIDKEIPTLMITEQDIYFKGLSFVFGLEESDTGCCIISLARLMPEFYDETPNEKLATERLIKEAIHEIGHLKGMDHCGNFKCVMAYSPSVGDMDQKERTFCEKCKIELMTKGIKL